MNARLLAITIMLLLVISGCGQSYNPEREKDCPGCDLIGVQLEGANLSVANLDEADLTGAVNWDVHIDMGHVSKLYAIRLRLGLVLDLACI